MRAGWFLAVYIREASAYNVRTPGKYPEDNFSSEISFLAFIPWWGIQ